MVQGRSRFGFLGEAPEPLRIGGEPTRQALDGHLAAEPGVLGRVDFAHAAFAEQLDNAVVLQRRAGLERQGHFGLAIVVHVRAGHRARTYD